MCAPRQSSHSGSLELGPSGPGAAGVEAQYRRGLWEGNVFGGQTRNTCFAEGILPVSALTLNGREKNQSLPREFLVIKLYLFTSGTGIYIPG